MASGDGKVTKAGWCMGGGCVKIKHNNTYQTVYAHMPFGRGIKGVELNKVKLLVCWFYRIINGSTFTL